MAIALFYALGTLIGGVSAPFLFGYLIGTGSQWAVAGGYFGAAVLMIGAAVCEAYLGIEGRREIAGGRVDAIVRQCLTVPWPRPWGNRGGGSRPALHIKCHDVIG
jgi:hypothetical protein